MEAADRGLYLESNIYGRFYLAVNNEPDYMPSQQKMHTQQHAFKTAPAMAPATEQNAAASATTSHEEMHMDMKDMNMDHSSHSGCSPSITDEKKGAWLPF